MQQTCNSQDTASDDGRVLKRRLENRHIQLISISGAIGTGLFMGSGKIIALSGTSIILVYAIIGFFVFCIMRAMGEMLLANLQMGSFADLVHHYLGPRAGFILSWSYWLSWVVAAVGDVVVRVDPRYYRPTEVETLLGDPTKARVKLGWTPKISLPELVKEMVESDYTSAKRDSLVKSAGFQAYDYHE